MVNNNIRIFHACQGVFYKKVSTASYISDPTDHTFLSGVQSVGVNIDTPSYSLPDIGRSQRNYLWYDQPDIEITIQRVIDKDATPFYTPTSPPVDYNASYFLNNDNFGMSGNELPNYNIVLIYGTDAAEYIGKIIDPLDPNPEFIESITYEYCLLTNISYTISANETVTESLTFITKSSRRNTDYLESTDYTNVPSFPESADLVAWRHITGGTYPDEVTQTFTPNAELQGLQSIDISLTINYDELTDIGNWRGSELETGTDLKANEINKWKYIGIPLEVTCSFTGVATQGFRSGDTAFNRAVKNVDENFNTMANAAPGQTADTSILIAASIPLGTKIDEEEVYTYYIWDLNNKNYLSSVSYSGGDAPSGNIEITLEYANTFNDYVPYRITNQTEVPEMIARGSDIL